MLRSAERVGDILLLLRALRVIWAAESPAFVMS
jgi:hypothetical protein